MVSMLVLGLLLGIGYVGYRKYTASTDSNLSADGTPPAAIAMNTFKDNLVYNPLAGNDSNHERS